MRKICIICPGAFPIITQSKKQSSAGGAEAQLATLGLSLKDKEYDVHFIVDDYGQEGVEKKFGVTLYKVALKYMGGSNYYVVPAWINLWKVLCKIDADIHLIKLPRHLLFLLGIFCKLFNKKLIFIGQIDTDINPNHIKQTEGTFLYFLFRLGVSLTDYFVAQNEIQQEGFAREYNRRSTIIKNIISLPAKEIKFAEKSDYALWVGNNHIRKQPEKFIELARRLPQYKFKMIMSISSQSRGDLFVRGQLPDIPNLDYLGAVPFSQIHEYFYQASIFVSTSLREGFPNTFLQSWQYGTPVVSLNVDPGDVIKKYILGKHSGSFDNFCEDVCHLMENSSLRERMGANGINYVMLNHSAEVIVSKYEEIFNEVLQ